MLSFQGLFVCQTLYLTYTIVGQCHSNIFFVDWERPRGRTSNEVSTWRTVLVANEWLSMQTARKHSITFSLVLVGLFVTFDSTNNGHPNIALRFASSCFFWGVSSFIQWLWRFSVFERWYYEPRGQRLVDLCTVCNISIFVLPEPHRGYYIHGRSPYQYSDCSMEELLDSFRKEVRLQKSIKPLMKCSFNLSIELIYYTGVRRMVSQLAEVLTLLRKKIKYSCCFVALHSAFSSARSISSSKLGKMRDHMLTIA